MVKEKIPASFKSKLWNMYIGIEKGNDLCFCCDNEPITRSNFHCGHIQSEKEGGELNFENMRPICGLCNSSIGTKNMIDFMKKYKYTIREDFYNKKNKKIKNSDSDNDITENLSKEELIDICNIFDIDTKGNKKQIIENIKENGFDGNEYNIYLSKKINNYLIEIDNIYSCFEKKIHIDTEINKQNKKNTKIVSEYKLINDKLKNTLNRITEMIEKSEQIEENKSDKRDVVSKSIEYIDEKDKKDTVINDENFFKKILSDLTIEELKDICEYKEISKTGNKKELIKKIKDNNFTNEEFFLMKLTNKELKSICENKKISKNGNKNELVKKIKDDGFSINDYNNKAYDNKTDNDSKLEIFLLELTNEELKSICESINVKKTGNKTEIIKRIKGADCELKMVKKIMKNMKNQHELINHIW
jgi:hypothetical protein